MVFSTLSYPKRVYLISKNLKYKNFFMILKKIGIGYFQNIRYFTKEKHKETKNRAIRVYTQAASIFHQKYQPKCHVA